MEELVQKYVEKIEHAIDYGNDVLTDPFFMRTKLTNVLLSIKGMSSMENRILLNELVDENSCYLEIGVDRGTTFISALYKNNAKYAVGIDHYGGPLFADDIKNKFIQMAEFFDLYESKDFHLIHNDCFRLNDQDVSVLSKHKFNIFFYDGAQTIESCAKLLNYYYEFLDDTFIFIVDDWSKQIVVDGIKKSLVSSNMKIVKEWNLGHSMFLKNSMELSWHNGLYVAILQK